jgi:DHA1 family tetracycline resistance protein-like MFS transporter
MTERVSASEQGQLQGTISSLLGVSGLIAPLLFTRVFSASIDTAAGLHLPGAPFLVAAILLVGSLVVALVAIRRDVQPLTPSSATP